MREHFCQNELNQSTTTPLTVPSQMPKNQQPKPKNSLATSASKTAPSSTTCSLSRPSSKTSQNNPLPTISWVSDIRYKYGQINQKTHLAVGYFLDSLLYRYNTTEPCPVSSPGVSDKVNEPVGVPPHPPRPPTLIMLYAFPHVS